MIRSTRAILLLFTVVVVGCSFPARVPQLPGVVDGPASTLVLDNQVTDSLLLIPTGIELEVAIDGFSPTDQLNLPRGQTTLHLPAGNYELTIKAQFPGNSPYYFNPIQVNFDIDGTKSYSITFLYIRNTWKPGYKIQYSGWTTEQSAGWPSEVYIANPPFGSLKSSDGAT